MFNYIMGKLKVGAKNIKTIVMVLVMGLLYALLLIINLADMSVDFGLLQKKEVWVTYLVGVGFSLVIMFLTITMRKDGLKRKPLIVDQFDYLLAIRGALVENGLFAEFRDTYLPSVNTKAKIVKYRSKLLRLRDTAKNEDASKKYDELFKATFAPDFDIEPFNIKIRPATTNIIFWGIRGKNEDDKIKIDYYSYEGLAERLGPTLLIGVMLFAAMLAMGVVFGEPTLDTAKNVLAIMGLSLSYIMSGVSFADYSVNEVFCSVLRNRQDIAKEFLAERGLIALVGENPSDKYKIVIEKETVQEENNNGTT